MQFCGHGLNHKKTSCGRSFQIVFPPGCCHLEKHAKYAIFLVKQVDLIACIIFVFKIFPQKVQSFVTIYSVHKLRKSLRNLLMKTIDFIFCIFLQLSMCWRPHSNSLSQNRRPGRKTDFCPRVLQHIDHII